MAAVLEHMNMSNLGESDFLPCLDTDCHDVSHLSSPTDCPSLSESFLSSSTAMTDGELSRRPSIGSSRASSSPNWYSTQSGNMTSPTTPTTSSLGAPFEGQTLKCEQDFDHTSLYDLAQFGLPDSSIWAEPDHPQSTVPHTPSASTMQLMEALGIQSQTSLCHGYTNYSQGISMNPSLSRPIFGVEEMVPGPGDTRHEPLDWSDHLTSPLQTIAPSAAFQPVLTSSPMSKHEPSTPCHRDMLSAAMLNSSPLTLVSPPIVPSQHDIDEFEYEIAEHSMLESDYGRLRSSVDSDYWPSAFTPQRRHSRPTMHRRGYERKPRVGPSCKPKPVVGKSGINCDAIIPQNEFACGFPDCIDRNTGFQKRFKRQEHKKRHEKTVHMKDGSHKCWVPECQTKPFTRTDNLKSHLKNTHGKRSANQRNRYVATQDKNSHHYAPDWEGDLTKEGYPVYIS